MTPRKTALPSNPWVLALLWINGAVAVVMAMALATGQIAGGAALARAAAHALLFANLTGLLGTALMQGLLRPRSGSAARWRLAVPLGLVAATLLGGLATQLLLVALGLADAADFGADYARNLRAALPLAVMFGLGAFVHARLQARVATMEEALRERERAELRLRELATETRLRQLEARIHPHFLFNALNAISALIPVNPAQAEHLVGRLAVLLRASLDSGRHARVPLRDELLLVNSYLAIEQARFGDRLRTAVQATAAAQEHPVPPMAVLSLVENAVKHGIMAGGEGRITVDARIDETGLHVEVRDSGPGFSLAAVPAGHGLDDLTARLQALYGDAAALRVFRRDDETVVDLALPASP